MMVLGVVVKNLMTTLDLGQSRVVLSELLKYIHGQRDWCDLCERVCGNTTAHGWILWSKNVLFEFMDLNGTNYKFMDLKIHFQSLWAYIFKVYGPNWHNLQVDRPKNTHLEFVDLNDTPYKLMYLWCILLFNLYELYGAQLIMTISRCIDLFFLFFKNK